MSENQPTRNTAMQHLTPQQAYDFLKSNLEAVFIDVRSEIEHLFVGHPENSILIPWIDGPDWEINPDFIGHVKKAASADRPVVLICRSGVRAADAGKALEKAGMTDVYVVQHGFEGELNDNHHRNSVNGWRYDGLPWVQM